MICFVWPCSFKITFSLLLLQIRLQQRELSYFYLFSLLHNCIWYKKWELRLLQVISIIRTFVIRGYWPSFLFNTHSSHSMRSQRCGCRAGEKVKTLPNCHQVNGNTLPHETKQDHNPGTFLAWESKCIPDSGNRFSVLHLSLFANISILVENWELLCQEMPVDLWFLFFV